MKRILAAALVLLVCVCCLASCDAMSKEIGRTASLAALDELESEMRAQDLDTVDRGTGEDIAAMANFLEEKELVLKGEVTGVIQGYKVNTETGYTFRQTVIGLSVTEDVEAVAQYYREEYAAKIEAEKVQVDIGGWIVCITEISPLDPAE